jgi:hypothetical protein
MQLLNAWHQLPEPERNSRLKALRAAAWLTLHEHEANRISIASRCCEAGSDGAWAALSETIGGMPTLSQRRLWRALCDVEVR